MLFDQKAELPVATLRRLPGSTAEVVASNFRRWLVARWQWFKPRTIPVTVAFVGMLGVLQAVSYLTAPPVETISTISVRLVIAP